MPQTLSCLLQDAMQKDLDLVVGRRWITWFKKQVLKPWVMKKMKN